MTALEHTIGLIGAGNMGEAITGAMIRSGITRPDRIRVSDVSAERLDYFKRLFDVAVTRDNTEIFSTCDVIILSVKPQQMNDVLAAAAQHVNVRAATRRLIISIAAGVRLSRIEAAIYAGLADELMAKLPIIRVMPNTPALVLAGISGMSPNRHCSAEDIRIAKTILSAMGRVIEFPETDLDAVTAVSGSGPAYVFYLAEAMIQGGTAAGLDPEKALTLAVETINGAVKLLLETGESPESLRKKVTSPGGTTEAALKVMDDNQVKRHISDAIIAATRRAGELSQTTP